MNPNESYLAADQRTLSVRTRADVVVGPIAFRGQAGYVVRDPLTTEAFQLSREEGFLLNALRHPTSLTQLQQQFAATFQPYRLTVHQLEQFVSQLYQYGLLMSEQSGAADRLAEQGQRHRRTQRWSRWLHLLAIRVGGCDAHGPIDQLYRWTRRLFSWPAALLAALVVLYAGLLLLGSADEVVSRLPYLADTLQPSRWPIWIGAICSVKLLHELGHALTCRHYGGRVREIGLLLLGFLPTLYCDVSDAWRLPGKRQRMAISAAGMIVEVIVAAAAAIIWWHTTPGLLNNLCLSIVVTASVGTILINANPLLRYDGYFLLSDWLEIPNLAEQSRGVLRRVGSRWLLGEAVSDETVGSRRLRTGLIFYAVASKAYLLVVLAAIFAMLLAVARPLRMEEGVYFLFALTLLGMVAPPVVAAGRMLGNPLKRMKLKWLRLASVVALVGLGVAGVLALPITRHVAAPATVVPADARPVFTTVAGQLEWALPPMAEVEAGDTIARLSNPELTAELQRARDEVAAGRLRNEQLNRLRVTHRDLAQEAPAGQAALADAEEQLAEYERQAALLTLRAPQAGRLLPPPRLPADAEQATLPSWTGRTLDPENRGAWLDAGVPIAAVAASRQWHAWAAVDPADVAAVEPGQVVRIALDGWAGQLFAGEVRHIARQATQGEEPAVDGVRPAYHVVEIALTSGDPLLRSGVSGQVKIETYATTVGGELVRMLRRQLRRF